MQDSFYGPSVAARQLLSLSLVCKEMRQLVLDTGLPDLAQQVRVNELLKLTVTRRKVVKRGSVAWGNCWPAGRSDVL